MRILHIGNSNRRDFGNRYYRFDARIHAGLLRAGHAVYFFCDRTEARDSRFHFKRRSYTLVRRNLLKVMKNFRPDMVLVTHSNVIRDAGLLLELRTLYPALRIGQFSVDALFSKSNCDGLLGRQPGCDATFVNTNGATLKKIAGTGTPFYFVPNLTDTGIDEGRAFAQDTLPFDVSCFMAGGDNLPEDQAQRIGWARAVKGALPELNCCYRGFDGAPMIFGYEYIEKTAAAAMGLNFNRYQLNGQQSTLESRYMYSSSRVGHIMGNGSLALSPDDFGLQDLYADNEMVFFHDEADLIEKVRFYHANPAARRAMAEAGWKRAHGDFNSAKIMQYVVERTMGLPLSQPYGWPTEDHR